MVRRVGVARTITTQGMRDESERRVIMRTHQGLNRLVSTRAFREVCSPDERHSVMFWCFASAWRG